MLKKSLRNERGLTLIELLAVIVILGIIAAIAVPSIGNIIDNSKKDAHIANAEQMVSAVRLAKASNVDGTATNKNEYTLDQLVDDGFLESKPESPGNAENYDGTKSKVVVSGDSNPTYEVTLTDGSNEYINEATITDLRKDASDSDETDTGRELVDLH